VNDEPKKLSHLTDDGSVQMVDVGAKASSLREAKASALVRMSPQTLQLLRERALPKGDVLTTAKVAAILAAKRTADLIPMTHPLPLTYIDVTFDVESSDDAIAIEALVRCEGKTGVEIEAMTACSIAALTIYDMCKSADKSIVIERIRLEEKSGGKSGTFRRSD
jgi:cyclic pyranopterin phosphate synthase